MIIVHIITSLKMGGAQNLLFELVKALNKKNIKNYVICFEKGFFFEKISNLNVDVFVIKKPYHKFFLLNKFLNFILLFRVIKKIQDLGRVDCIHSWLFLPNFLSRLIGLFLGIPVLNSLHSTIEIVQELSLLDKILDKSTIFLPDKIIAVSTDIKRKQLERDSFLSPKKIETIKNGIDYKFILKRSNKKTRLELNINKDAFIIGTVGNLVACKNHELLIETFIHLNKIYDNLYLIIVGSGPREIFLRLKIKKNKLEDKVLLIIGREALDYYSLFDCFVYTSICETVSLSILEAMAFGIPCIAVSNFGQHEILTSGVNGLISKNSKLELADNINLLIKKNDLRRKLSLNAYQTLKSKFNLNLMVKKYLKVYTDLKK